MLGQAQALSLVNQEDAAVIQQETDELVATYERFNPQHIDQDVRVQIVVQGMTRAVKELHVLLHGEEARAELRQRIAGVPEGLLPHPSIDCTIVEDGPEMRTVFLGPMTWRKPSPTEPEAPG